MLGNMLTLYRGDSTKIAEFDLHKTYKNCLYGQGIYLTNSLEVAHSYRTKEATESQWQEPILFVGKAANRPEAFAKAFEQFLYPFYYYKEGVKLYSVKQRKQYEKAVRKHEAEARRFFDLEREEGRIKAEYIGLLERELRVTWDFKRTAVTLPLFWQWGGGGRIEATQVQRVDNANAYEHAILNLERRIKNLDDRIRVLSKDLEVAEKEKADCLAKVVHFIQYRRTLKEQ